VLLQKLYQRDTNANAELGISIFDSDRTKDALAGAKMVNSDPNTSGKFYNG